MVEGRRELKGKLESARTRNKKLATTQNYNKMTREIKRSCNKDKRKRIDSVALAVERAAEMNDIKKVYQTKKMPCRKKNIQRKSVKDKSGILD